MTWQERIERFEKCDQFFDMITKELQNDGYELLYGRDPTRYSAMLIPKGTRKEVSYYNHPIGSFRIAVRWSWYSTKKRCKNEDHIQCENVSLMKPNERKGPGLESEPIWAWCVAYFAEDRKYHTIYGTIYNNRTKAWDWLETSPEDICKDLKANLLVG